MDRLRVVPQHAAHVLRHRPLRLAQRRADPPQRIEHALAGCNAELCFAEDGAQALNAVVEAPPDLVLLDLLMPELDGWHVLSALQASPSLRTIPVIIVTRVADDEHESKALAAGATDFIAKPFTPSVLQARMRNALRLRLQAQHALNQERIHWRRVSDERLADVVTGASEGIMLVDEEGRIRLCNRAADGWWPRLSTVRDAQPAQDSLVGQRVHGTWPELPSLLATTAGRRL